MTEKEMKYATSAKILCGLIPVFIALVILSAIFAR